MTKLDMDPPNRGEVLTILDEGRERHGWRWLQCENGYWWGARQNADHILQVRPEPPEFPTRRWNATSGADYTPMPRWRALREVV